MTRAEKDKAWRLENREYLLEQKKIWYQANKKRISEENKTKNKERRVNYGYEWRSNNPDYHKSRYKSSYEYRADYFLNYWRERYYSDDLFKLAAVCRGRIHNIFKCKNIKKKNQSKELIGCSWRELKDRLSNQFTEGMTLENHGKWHIDHIIPLASAKTEEELIKLCNYKNLQPLWAVDNLKKSDNILYNN